MSDYSYDINFELYKYSQPIYITEPTGERQTYVPLKLSLNSANFNFDLARTDGHDFRLSERSNGSGILKMWVAYWDYSSKKATLWFNLPELLPSETRIMYAFWGLEYDSGISDLEGMVSATTKEYSSNLCIGGIPSGFTPDTNHGSPAECFDGDTETYWWAGNPGSGWIQYDFGSGNEKQIEFVRMDQYDIQNLAIKGSNDGTTFVTLFARQFPDMPGGVPPYLAEWVLTAFDNNVSYRTCFEC